MTRLWGAGVGNAQSDATPPHPVSLKRPVYIDGHGIAAIRGDRELFDGSAFPRRER
jgi:hypothetical protein